MSQFEDAESSDEAHGAVAEPEEPEEDEEEEEAGEFDDWDEEQEAALTASLLEPDRKFESVEAAMAHDASLGFDVEAFKQMGAVYDRIRLINYVRRQVADGKSPWSGADVASKEKLLEEARASEGLPAADKWQSDDYLQPVLLEDLYMTWADEEHFEEDDEGQHQNEDKYQPADEEALVQELESTSTALAERAVDLEELRK